MNAQDETGESLLSNQDSFTIFQWPGANAYTPSYLQVWRRTNVFGTRADQTVVRILLEDMRCPAGHAAHRKERREQIDRHADHVIRAGRIKVYIGIQLFLGFHERLDPRGHFIPLPL